MKNVRLVIKYNDLWSVDCVSKVVTADFWVNENGIPKDTFDSALKEVLKYCKKDCSLNVHMYVDYVPHSETQNRFNWNSDGKLTKGVRNETSTDFESYVPCAKSDIVAVCEFMRQLAVYASKE